MGLLTDDDEYLRAMIARNGAPDPNAWAYANNPVGTETTAGITSRDPTLLERGGDWLQAQRDYSASQPGILDGPPIDLKTGAITPQGQRYADLVGGMIGGIKDVPRAASVLADGTIMAGENQVGRVKYEHGPSSTRIGDIQIDPSSRNQGFGSSAIQQIQDEAAARGNPVVLSTDAFRGKQAQADQLRLYQRLGFVPNTGPSSIGETIGGKRVAEDLVWHPPSPEPEGLLGVRAYHGSPHSFDAFDSSKIGTGEGAQAYGHGLYAAEAEPVAESYLGPNAGWKYGGKKAQSIYDQLQNPALERGLDNDGWSKLNAQRGFWEKTVLGRAPRQIIEDALANPDEYGANELAYIKSLDPAKFKRTGGNMYEVNIAADPEHFLHWDKPLSEQPKAAVKALRAAGYPEENIKMMLDPPPGMGGYRSLPIGDTVLGIDRILKTPEGAATMRAHGIPGIKYLDQGSRGAGEGTHNYVVFSPETLKILRKYGLAGLMAGGGAAAATQPPEPQGLMQ